MPNFKRIFCRNNAETDAMEWFFNAREDIYGPFFSEAQAISALEEFIKFNIEFSDDGGRSSKQASTL